MDNVNKKDNNHKAQPTRDTHRIFKKKKEKKKKTKKKTNNPISNLTIIKLDHWPENLHFDSSK